MEQREFSGYKFEKHHERCKFGPDPEQDRTGTRKCNFSEVLRIRYLPST